MITRLPHGSLPRPTNRLLAAPTDFLADLHAEFLDYQRYDKRVTPRTIEWHQLALVAYRRVSQDVPSTDNFRTFVRDCHQRGLAASSINCYLRALRAFCRWLKLMRYVDTVPEVPSLIEDKPAIQVLTPVEVTRLLGAPMKPRLRFLIALILKTGLRIDEALALRWEDVNIAAGTIHVRSGKGRKGRIIPLEPECDPPLWGFSIRPWWYPHRRAFTKLATVGPSTWVFPTRNNTPWDQDTARRWLHRAMTRAGVKRERLSGWHLLRHSYATECLRRGGHLVRLQRRLGHSRVTTTSRYEHLMPDDLKQL